MNKPFQFDSEARFDCSGCAKCCRTRWNIRVDEERFEQLKSSRLVLELQVRDGRSPFYQKASGAVVTNRREGACAFLEQESCSIHAHHGSLAKPLTCQLFPFVITETPESLVVGASRYCSAVARGEGGPLENHRAELERLRPELKLTEVGAGPLTVARDLTIGWSGYRQLETVLLERLRSGPAEAVCLGLLEGIGQWLRQGRQPSLEHLMAGGRPWLEKTLLDSGAVALIAWSEEMGSEPRLQLSASLRSGKPVHLPRSGVEVDYQGSAPQSVLLGYLRSLVFRKFLVRRQPMLTALISL
ncbi:MAG: YkgJ family cysteine cluster protein, partial [Candidatus Eremiobacteraeota bacterium]|nr:YkgJ family cysteine cluster protein [Candidatus Eremiobacteraeota bacterium]